MDSLTIIDIPIQQLRILENLSQRTINICNDNGINTLEEILKLKKENFKFSSLRNCGVKTDSELLHLCDKYENYHFLNSIEDTDNSEDSLVKVKPIVNEDIEIKTLLEIEGMSIISCPLVEYTFRGIIV